MKAHLQFTAAALAVGFSVVPSFTAEQWQDLFDGNTLNGWIQRGGKADYKAVEGVIIGTTVTGTPIALPEPFTTLTPSPIYGSEH